MRPIVLGEGASVKTRAIISLTPASPIGLKVQITALHSHLVLMYPKHEPYNWAMALQKSARPNSEKIVPGGLIEECSKPPKRNQTGSRRGKRVAIWTGRMLFIHTTVPVDIANLAKAVAFLQSIPSKRRKGTT